MKGVALCWKYPNHVITVIDDEVTEWPKDLKKPSDKEISEIINEYEIYRGWSNVRSLQRSMIVEHDDMMTIYERELAHLGTEKTTITTETYQNYLSYFQKIRASDDKNYNSPEEAFKSLEKMTPPLVEKN